jgi:Zn-dependent protease
MGQSIRIGRIFGVQIGLHPSWFVIALIVTYLMAASELPGTY